MLPNVSVGESVHMHDVHEIVVRRRVDPCPGLEDIRVKLGKCSTKP